MIIGIYILEYLLHTEHIPVQKPAQSLWGTCGQPELRYEMRSRLGRGSFRKLEFTCCAPLIFSLPVPCSPMLQPNGVFQFICLWWLPAGQMVSRDFSYYAYCTLWDSQVGSHASTRQDPCCLPLMEKSTKYRIICARKHNVISIILFGLDFLCNNGRRT